tara:strand:- start:746 stop:865 length:120 start_codon:yes stop_codon:yes gene_type:complete
MENLTESFTVLGFILSIGLFGYGLKKIFLKVEKNNSNNI